MPVCCCPGHSSIASHFCLLSSLGELGWQLCSDSANQRDVSLFSFSSFSKTQDASSVSYWRVEAGRFSALCITHLTHHQSVSYQSLTFDRESDISFVCASVLEPENRELRGELCK